jgi:hypothetical protein
MKLGRSTYYYRGRRSAAEKKVLRDRIEALCTEFPRDGYRRITRQLHAEGRPQLVLGRAARPPKLMLRKNLPEKFALLTALT